MPSFDNDKHPQKSVKFHPFDFQVDAQNSQQQVARNTASPNVIRGSSAVSVQPFRLFESAAKAGRQDRTQDVLQDDASGAGNTTVSNAAEATSVEDSDRDGLLRQAREEATQCLQQAHEQVETLKTAAYQDGLEQGIHAAQQEVAQQFAPVLESLHQATEQILGLRQETLRLAEDDIITLALQLARKIVGQEIHHNRDLLATTLRRALNHLGSSDAVVVYVNPDDLQIAQEQHQELMRNLANLRQLTLETDESVGQGGCLVQSAFGEIDARIEAQFEELEQGLRDHVSTSTEVNTS